MGFMDEYYKALQDDAPKGSSNGSSGGGSSSFMDEYYKAGGSAPSTKKTSGTGVNAPTFKATRTSEKKKKKKEEEERSWFKKGLFDDGYDFGDISRTILGTATDVLENVGSGIIGMGEKAVDAMAYMAPYAANSQFYQNGGGYNLELQKQQEKVVEQSKKDLGKFIAKDLYDEEKIARAIISDPARMIGVDSESHSVFGEKSDALIQSGGQLLATAGLSAVGVPWFVTTGATSFGSEAENAMNQGATYEEAGASAAISAGAEILSEKLSGGISFGGKTLDDALTKQLARGISNKIGRTFAKLGIDMAGEGAEEVFSQVASNIGSSLYKEESLNDLLFSEEAFDEYLESFIGGAALGGVANTFNAVKSNKQGVDYTSGLTANEEAVVKKVYNDRVAEAEKNGKVSQKEKSRMYDQVVSEMDKGYLSIDDIESALGGKTYEDYKSISEWEDGLQKEYDELHAMKRGEMTGEQIDREAELKKQLEESRATGSRESLKSHLGDEVFGLVKGDRLMESYNERTRRGQAFEADLSKYDAKQQATIQKAIDSGILNNTNRTHEFVDIIAKISADKGVLFDFTNNTKLKESGFAVEGKQVNGFVTKDGITLNIDSPKAWQSTVGHEITHVLEGTELYNELQKTMFDYAKTKGEYDSRMKSLTELYKDVKDADVNAELTADLVGEYLFTDEDFIKNLSTEHRNVFQKIYDEIKYLVKVATGSKEARELEKVKRAFDKAYKEAGKETEVKAENFYDSETKYSLRVTDKETLDTLNNQETVTTYKTMQLVDGKLYPPMASRIEGKFEDYSELGAWEQATEHPELIKNGNKFKLDKGKGQGSIEAAYNPYMHSSNLVLNDQFSGAYKRNNLVTVECEVPVSELTSGYHAEFAKDSVGWHPWHTGTVAGQLRNAKGTERQVLLSRWIKPVRIVPDSEVAAMYKELLDGTNVEVPDNVVTPSLLNELKKAGVKIKESGRVKYSLSDSDGKQLTKEQQDYFKDSKMRDENGSLKVMYHGSQDAGFHVFDPKMSDDDTSFFFVDRNEVAASYSGTSETYEAKTIRTAEDMNNFLAEIGYDQYEAIEKDGKFELLENNEHVATSDTAQGIYEEFCWYEGVGEGDANYKVYLNLKNPLEVDAGGRNWNNISREYSQEVADRYHSLTAEEKAALTDVAEWGEISIFRDAKNNPPDAVTESAFAKMGDVNIYDLFTIAEDSFSEESIKQFAVKQMNTRDYAQKAKAEGYDGVIFKNIHDNGGYSNGSEGASTVAIAFDSNQIKSVANAKPTADPDIRYSLSADSEGRELSPATAKRFGKSRVVDENGNLKAVYHGTATGEFSIFDKSKGSVEGDFGSGFYFTDNEADVSEHYEGGGPDFENKVARLAEQIEADEDIDYEEAEERARAELYKGSHKFEVYLNIENPAIVGETILLDSESYLEQYNEEDYEDYDEYIADVEQLLADDIENIVWEVERNVDIDSADGLADVLYDAYYEGGIGIEELKAKINELYLEDSNGNLAGNEVARQVIESLGYDGIIDPTVSSKWNMDIEDGTTHYIVFKPNQIKAVTNQNPTDNPDIHRSLSKIGEAPRKTGQFATPATELRLTTEESTDIAPVAENATVQEKTQLTEENSTDVTAADMQALFPDDAVPVQEELERLEAHRKQLYGALEDAVNVGSANDVGKLAEEYEAVNSRIKALEQEEAERTGSLTDAPPEMDAPFYGEPSKPTAPDDPFYDRDISDVGKRSVKAYQYENPEVKPFFQEAALGMLYDVANTTKGEKWYNDQLYYESGGEKGFGGTKRSTTPDIAELKDVWGYTYDQIEKGLNDIIEDDGKENNAVSKRIEFMLNDRLLNGYKDVEGRPYEPNQDYIRLLNEKQVTEYSKEAFDNFMANADQYAPTLEEYYAPILNSDPRYEKTLPAYDLPGGQQTYIPTKATYDAAPTEDIAPIFESKDKNAVKGQTTMFEPPKPNPKVANVLTEESSIAKEKSGIGTKLVSSLVDKGMVFENLSLKTGNHELQAKWNYTLPSNTEARAQHFMEKGADGVKPLKDIKKTVDKSGKADDFFTYLYHVHNIDRMTLEDRFGVENKTVFGETVTADVSRKKVAQYEKKNPEFKSWANDVYAYNKHLRQLLVDGNVISQETANLWERMYPHYVPIRRVDSKGNNISVPLDTNKTGVNNPVKRAIGGNSDIQPVFSTMAQRTEQTYRAIARNAFGIELKNTLGTTINSQENTTGVDEAVDTLVAQEDHLLKPGTMTSNPTFTVFENGEKVEFEITEDMFDALKPAGKVLGHRSKAVTSVSEWRRNLLTTWNPVFALYRNPIKDLQDVGVNSQHPVKTYANVPNAIYQIATGGKWATEYAENGGKSNTYFDSRSNKFKAEDSVFKKTIGLPLKALENAGEFIEEIPRLAEYIASRKDGRSVERSMLDAARVTTNFAAGGDFTKFLNSHGFTFLNASVQGASQHVRNFREAKQQGLKGYVKVLAKYTVAGLPGILLNNLLWDDDEDYEELNDYVKQNYYVVAKTQDGKFIRIPKGRTAAVMQNAMEQMEHLVTGDDEADFGTFYELFMNNIAPNNPIENNILAPIWQAKNNEAWYGGDLVPSRLQKLPGEEQFDESTDSFSKWLGEKTGASPYKINYLIDQYSGGAGDMILPMLTPEAESGDNSFMGNMLAPWKKEMTTDNVLNNRNPGDFYELRDELEVVSNSKNATEEDKMRTMYLDSVSWEMSDLYAKKREIQNSDLPDDEKYEAVREVQEEINGLAKNAMENHHHVQITGLYSEAGDKRYNLDAESGKWYEIKPKNADGSDNWYYQKEQEVTKGLGISYEQYWNNREEYNYAYDKPGKYALAQAVGGYDSYMEHYDVLENWQSDRYLGADKDSNGNSINGSRKEKVIDYINGLDADYGEKIILYRTVYSSKADKRAYNQDIIDYLNERDDISYEQMKYILEELDMEVDSEGNITW